MIDTYRFKNLLGSLVTIEWGNPAGDHREYFRLVDIDMEIHLIKLRNEETSELFWCRMAEVKDITRVRRRQR